VGSILLDARWLSTGIGTYTLNLIKELHTRNDIQLRLVTLPQHAATLKTYCQDVGVVDAPMYSIKEQFALGCAAHNSSVLHVPHYNAPVMYRGSLLITILDLTHILDRTFKKTVKSKLYARPILSVVSKKAKHIFTLSQYSKRTIVDQLGVPDDKVTVTHCGVASHFYPEDRQKASAVMQRECGAKGAYILFVGNLKPHKNIPGLLRAFANLTKRPDHKCDLVIIGEETVLPSFEEGFGLPVIESMACGTPVACSNAAALPEVGGAAATYFDPTDTDSMALAIRHLLESVEQRTEHQRLGAENIKRFTWSSCAEKHLDVYRRYIRPSSTN
jgi:glycosyltransferase involved in cell wall biosynthesis